MASQGRGQCGGLASVGRGRACEGEGATQKHPRDEVCAHFGSANPIDEVDAEARSTKSLGTGNGKVPTAIVAIRPNGKDHRAVLLRSRGPGFHCSILRLDRPIL